MQFVSYMTPGFPRRLFEVMAREIDAELHLEHTMSGPVPGDDPFRDGRYDLGWICSTSYVGLTLGEPEPSVRLAGVAWVPDDPDVDGRPVYFGDLVTRAGSGIRSLDDLAGRTVGCNDPVSLSGHHALRHALELRGHDPDSFAMLTFTGGHHTSLDMVADGRLDAAVVDSVVRVGRARHDQRVADLTIVDRLGPWPVQPLVARSGVADDDLATIQRILLAANDRPDVAEQLEAAALARLVAVEPDHYDPVRRMMND